MGLVGVFLWIYGVAKTINDCGFWQVIVFIPLWIYFGTFGGFPSLIGIAKTRKTFTNSELIYSIGFQIALIFVLFILLNAFGMESLFGFFVIGGLIQGLFMPSSSLMQERLEFNKNRNSYPWEKKNPWKEMNPQIKDENEKGETLDVDLLREKFKDEGKKLVEKLKEVKESGMSPEQAGAVMDEFIKPKTFYTVIGDLRQKHNWASQQSNELLIREEEEKEGKAFTSEEKFNLKKREDSAWKEFIDSQTHCDKFFNNHSDVREWVITKSLVDKGFTEEQLQLGNPDALDRLRNKNGWQRVSWTFHVAELVEKKNGPDSCTKELLFETWAKINSDDYLQQFIGGMSEEEINHWKLL